MRIFPSLHADKRVLQYEYQDITSTESVKRKDIDNAKLTFEVFPQSIRSRVLCRSSLCANKYIALLISDITRGKEKWV